MVLIMATVVDLILATESVKRDRTEIRIAGGGRPKRGRKNITEWSKQSKPENGETNSENGRLQMLRCMDVETACGAFVLDSLK